MAEVSSTNKKLTVPLGIVTILVLAGVAVAAGLHNNKPATIQKVTQTANADNKRHSPSSASVLGASTDVASDVTSDEVAPTSYQTPTVQNSPSNAPVVVTAATDTTAPTNAIPVTNNPADNNSGDLNNTNTDVQTGGLGAGGQTDEQTSHDQTGSQGSDEQSVEQGDGQTGKVNAPIVLTFDEFAQYTIKVPVGGSSPSITITTGDGTPLVWEPDVIIAALDDDPSLSVSGVVYQVPEYNMDEEPYGHLGSDYTFHVQATDAAVPGAEYKSSIYLVDPADLADPDNPNPDVYQLDLNIQVVPADPAPVNQSV